MPFACFSVPNFSMAAALRAEPELQARPVAILEGKPPLEKIIAVNEKAGASGITPGIPKAQGELCTELALRSRSPLQESQFGAQFALRLGDARRDAGGSGLFIH